MFRMNRVVKLFLEKVRKIGFPILHEGTYCFLFGKRDNCFCFGTLDQLKVWINSNSGIDVIFNDWGKAEQFIQYMYEFDFININD